MMYTLDLSGHGANGDAGIDRIGGLFMTVEGAIAHGRVAAQTGRQPFRPEVIWVRDQEGEVVRRDNV